MSDKKISQLTAATTPLVGDEVLPLVQGGLTVKVPNNDLRPKQIQSNATSGVLQIAGPAAATTRVMTTPNANFSSARIDATQSFIGNQTFSTGNLVIGTAGKGIDFSVTSGAGTSELLADYEEGTWTPTLVNWTGSISSFVCYYTKVGRLVHVWGILVPSTTFATAAATSYITGLPFNPVTDGPPITWTTAFTGQLPSIIVLNRLYAPTVVATSANFYFSCTYNT